MTVPVQTPVSASIANGATTVFPYGFKIADEEDIAVTVDGVLQTSGYTVSGVGNPAGGNITFSVAPTNGKKVVRFLAPVLKRETDYQQFGDWLAAVVNLDFDRVWLALQALQQNVVRSMKLPVDTAVDQVLTQDATARANRTIKFDGAGNLTISTYDPDGAQAAAAASATAAAGSATAAGTSAANAANSATTAASSATSAANSATQAANSAASVGFTLTSASAFQNKTMTAAGGNSVEATSGPGVSAFTLRNKIINGYMRFDQRNAGAALNAVGTGYTNSIDRWQIYSAVAGKFNIQQNAGGVSPPAGFPFYLGVTTASAFTPGAGDYNFISQKIEADNVSTLYWGQPSAKGVTLSFWARSSLVGTHSGFVANAALTATYPFTFSIAQANTWEYKTVTIPGPTSGSWNITGNGIGIHVGFNLGNGSSFIAGSANSWTGAALQAPGAQSVIGTAGATFYVTGVQLEEGSVATPFELRNYGVELSMCQRYYQVDTNGSFVCSGVAYSSTLAVLTYRLATPMRAAPTLGYSAAGDFRVWGSAKQVTVNSLTNSGATTTAMRIDAGVASGLAAGEGATLEAYLAAARLTFSAEL